MNALRWSEERTIRAIQTLIVFCVLWTAAACPARAEDGYDLWLRYRSLPAARAAALAADARSVVIAPGAAGDRRVRAAAAELERGLGGLTGRSVSEGATVQDGAIVLAVGASGPAHPYAAALAGLGQEGYLVYNAVWRGHRITLVAANSGVGILYGAFALLRQVQTGGALGSAALTSTPRIQLRMLDHWDNLDGSIERGYAGASIWNWWTLPEHVDARLTDYARANASIGINGAVLNNVNAKADSLTDCYIAKAAAIADVLRPYGIRVYLSARFSAPIELGGLNTADPLDPAVAAWWRGRIEAIYRAIPDFGGFLVKASSEGQPGPGDYGRSHADGANMLAAALAPHHGVVMWRAFVYSADNHADRVKQAYDEFKTLDGRFAPNVILQVKNGPLDFQPREPFHPLFGAMPKTPLMMEFEITKEYLGQATHLVYLGPLCEEVLRAEAGPGPNGTVADIVDGRRDGHALTGIAGVANIGADRDWSGSTFNQANWYAFGRLAWNPEASSRAIAAEWAAMTLSDDPAFVAPTVAMMMASREAVVDYMTPLGLAHMMGTGHHYGPAPWVADQARPEWNPVYYHRADAHGIGFDRTATGSDALAQYDPAAAARLAADPRYLLWFHHLRWTAIVPDEKQPLWDALVHHYDRGVAAVTAMRATWARLAPYVDRQRFAKTGEYLAIQQREARWWRDACIAYFQSLNHLPLPPGSAAPAHPLAWYEALRFPYAPGQ